MRSRERTREEEKRERFVTVNGGKTEGNEGGKKSCAATFECRENAIRRSAESFARDAPPRGERKMIKKNEQAALISLD